MASDDRQARRSRRNRMDAILTDPATAAAVIERRLKRGKIDAVGPERSAPFL